MPKLLSTWQLNTCPVEQGCFQGTAHVLKLLNVRLQPSCVACTGNTWLGNFALAFGTGAAETMEGFFLRLQQCVGDTWDYGDTRACKFWEKTNPCKGQLQAYVAYGSNMLCKFRTLSTARHSTPDAWRPTMARSRIDIS